MKLKIVHYDKISRQVQTDDGRLAGLILQLTNERWGAYDLDGKKLTRLTYKRPIDVLDAHFDDFLALIEEI